ncbi:energy-coupling factor transporter transmembrane component T family protein [Desulfoferrobacter suflitae]|uniref:energy-coupling factor transporter transmembrane component T family protein n=1 Tax=Desulfoferrobacter suflitae TaxID=2865782 RepID=UPI00216418E0|nr:energy-coupling factor transporter transmembrane component T [Desulfoferrobacter suflitae]MCK8600305.1 energy-coupling factor transporter transmembrane protein EcfT [Desulfoferrobacter suflitae]
MADRLMLHYFPGNTPLHHWDARCKFPGLMIVTLSLLQMDVPSLVLFTLVFFAAFGVARLPGRALLLSGKPWLLFLAIIFIVQVFFQHPSFWDLPHVKAAGIVCWRLALMLAYAILFTLVTKPREMQDAITWFLRPLPFLPARRIAMMVSLTVKFLPLLLDQFAEVQLAVKSRMGNRSGRSLRHIKTLCLPLFRRSFIRCDELALALAARGYREDLPLTLPRIRLFHVLALLLVGVVALAGALLN